MHRMLCLLLLYFTANIYGQSFDVVIYGGTSAGVIAAVQAQKMGHSVALVEPGRHLGGMTSNGLGWVDIKTPLAVGGLTYTYFNRVWQYYQNASSWNWETKQPMKGQLVEMHADEPLMWVLEPHVGEQLFNAMIAESNVTVLLNQRLNTKTGVQMNNQRIVQIEMETGLVLSGAMFIDASYEGDLMAAANVSYTIGREPNSQYQETLNGIYADIPASKKLLKIDPYRSRGNPQSGYLPRVYPSAGGVDGEGDRSLPAYNYRMCLTDVPPNRAFIKKPIGYDERHYEIIFRAIEAGINPEEFFKLDPLPNRKTDSNNHGSFSTDFVGMSDDYPEADYAARKFIAYQHEQWMRGLVWTLQNHPRVPDAIKSYYAPWGLPKDEFTDNNNWPYMLYVREARRMVSPVVITEHTALGNVSVEDSIGLTHYDMDSHDVKYFASAEGFLVTDGGLYGKVEEPYPVSYQAIVPSRSECENLLVPVCLSASHAAYGSIRVEPTYMILGQSAATAACLAIKHNVAVQDVPYHVLRKHLLADGQILDWSK